jgi:LysR family hydrogen peroxide-inducible transcriptional activator
MLPRILPALQTHFPELRIELRETQTRTLLDELHRGALDALLLALPVDESDIETLTLFNDPFLLALPAGDPLRSTARLSVQDVDQRRLILLEEGHCLRDQALAFCGTRIDVADATGHDPQGLGLQGLGPQGLGPQGLGPQGLGPQGLGATSLATVMQMVANGYGITLMPRIALDVEGRDQRVKVLRFREPEPARRIGLAWRRTSARKADFTALGAIVREQFAA